MSRSLVVKESKVDLQTLYKNHYRLLVAKSVAKGPNLIFNMVWQSKVLAPTIDVSWTPVYAFNWATEVPSPGLEIKLRGCWQTCSPGEVYDLDETGSFVSSTHSPTEGYMSIGHNGYSPETPDNGINIVIGVSNGEKFTPIFVDPDKLGPNGSGIYQPQQQLQWWFQESSKTGAMISQQLGPVEQADFSSEYSRTSSFDTAVGKWNTTYP